MKPKLTIFLLFSTMMVLGQSKKIGNVNFKSIHQEGKPIETLGGQVAVFENNVSNNGKKINLNVEVVPAKSSEKKNAPIFIIMGGPGQAATDLVSFFSEIFEKLNQNSDLVFIDQRGTGKSNPLQLISSYNIIQDYFKDDFVSPAVISKSYASLSQKNNLRHYGTLNAITDIESVRREMGYGKINLYGTSYGTRVSLAYINKYPHNVRTATLKGLVPYDLVIPLQFATDAQRSLELLIEDCKNNDSCKASYPDLKRELENFFAKKSPVTATILNPVTKKTETILISKEIFALNLRVLLMSPSTTKNIPYLIAEANKGNLEPWANTIMAVKKSYIKGVYDGMTLCVICNEDYPYISDLTSKKENASFLDNYWIYRVKNACAIWNTEKTKPRKVVIKKQQTPVLLLSGNRDAATPPKYGEQVLKYFQNGKHIVINQGSHSFDGMRNCVENIICDFVIKGNTEQLNTECVDKVNFPDYKLK